MGTSDQVLVDIAIAQTVAGSQDKVLKIVSKLIARRDKVRKELARHPIWAREQADVDKLTTYNNQLKEIEGLRRLGQLSLEALIRLGLEPED